MPGLYTLPEADRLRIQKELHPGEQVRWCAKPHPGRASRAAYLVWLFAVPWTIFSLFFFGAGISAPLAHLFGWGTPPRMESGGAMSIGMGLLFALFSLPFLGTGFALLGAPFYARHKATHTAYIITTERAFSITGGRSTKVESCAPGSIGKVEKKLLPDGSGTLTVQTGFHRDSDGDRVIDTFELIAVPDINAAERALEELRAAPRTGAPH